MAKKTVKTGINYLYHGLTWDGKIVKRVFREEGVEYSFQEEETMDMVLRDGDYSKLAPLNPGPTASSKFKRFPGLVQIYTDVVPELNARCVIMDRSAGFGSDGCSRGWRMAGEWEPQE